MAVCLSMARIRRYVIDVDRLAIDFLENVHSTPKLNQLDDEHISSVSSTTPYIDEFVVYSVRSTD